MPATVFTATRLDPADADQLALLARASHRSVSAELRLCVRRHLNESAAGSHPATDSDLAAYQAPSDVPQV